jgi:ADP-ribose pyrophosphatase YjhB (NUDIX family)
MHRNPSPTVDVAVIDGERILLVKRGRNPFKDNWALPGGFVEYGEAVEEAAAREILEETGVHIKLEAILGVYSDPRRDPRGHTITTVFIARPVAGEPVGGDDAAEAFWVDLKSLDGEMLAFDHSKIVEDLIQWLLENSTFWSSKDRQFED